ncbi:unnamed protein product [Lactuca saligna]|uniref:Uncharacterized protein n=1 Tax=Lactuca saligna TaxID=75948 RepID=A0AA36A4P3_LACSI|nr:unnamed protein product [Lactuca saligna]
MLKAKNKDNKMSIDEIESKACSKVIDIECKLDKFFKTYLEWSNMTSSSQQETPEEVVNFDDENEFFGSYMNSRSFPSTSSESQLQRYLKEDPIGFDKGYDILTWWKITRCGSRCCLNGNRYFGDENFHRSIRIHIQ